MKVILILMMMAGVVFGEEVKVRAGQLLMIDVTGVSAAEKGRLNNAYSVSKEGEITMWKIGKIHAAGKTRSALAKEIATAYRELGIYDKAVFQVRGNFDPGEVRLERVTTIGGQVRAPGQRKWKEGMTLADALKAAGGATPFGDLAEVRLYRKGKVYRYDLRRKEHQKVVLEKRDMIEIPDARVKVIIPPKAEEGGEGVK